MSVCAKPEDVCISAEHISKSFALGAGRDKRIVQVLTDVSVSIKLGEMVAIIGASGSGKSTLLYCLSTLNIIDSGRTVIMDHDIKSMKRSRLWHLRRDYISFIFQSYNLISSLSVKDNILLPLRFANQNVDDVELTRVLTLLGMQDRIHSLPSDLSGGEQQRVAIARALLSKAPIIFADEPTGALDSINAAKVLELLRETVDCHSRTVVMVTHNIQAAACADRVLVLKDGRITSELYHASTQDILDALGA